MTSITISLDNKLKTKIEKFSWVNWSDIGRIELMKKELFERFLKSSQLSKEDQQFCDKIDWYPIDDLELKEEFIKELKKKKKKIKKTT